MELNRIELMNITKQFGYQKVLDQLTLEMTSLEPTVICGPSGCGKSTLLRVIAGLEMPDEGQVYLNGMLCSTSAYILEPHRRGIGFVFQNPALWPHLTVEQNIRFGLAHLSPQESRARVSYYLVHTSLDGMAKRYPAQLSGGEARRVSIARALALQPQFLLMDEPLTNLDYELKQTILECIIAEQQQAGCCLVYVTHDLEEAARVSSRIIRMPGVRHA